MNTYIVLLRGINVSGQKLIKMTDLKILLEKSGFEHVITYIQSGNIVLKSSEKDKISIKNRIIKAIHNQYYFDVPVMVLEPDFLKNIFQKNPYTHNRKEEIKFLHFTFLDHKPNPAMIEDVKKISSGADEFTIADNIVYLFCPNGYGKTKYTNTFFEYKFQTSATTRNFKTVLKLIELSSY